MNYEIIQFPLFNNLKRVIDQRETCLDKPKMDQCQIPGPTIPNFVILIWYGQKNLTLNF